MGARGTSYAAIRARNAAKARKPKPLKAPALPKDESPATGARTGPDGRPLVDPVWELGRPAAQAPSSLALEELQQTIARLTAERDTALETEAWLLKWVARRVQKQLQPGLEAIEANSGRMAVELGRIRKERDALKVERDGLLVQGWQGTGGEGVTRTGGGTDFQAVTGPVATGHGGSLQPTAGAVVDGKFDPSAGGLWTGAAGQGPVGYIVDPTLNGWPNPLAPVPVGRPAIRPTQRPGGAALPTDANPTPRANVLPRGGDTPEQVKAVFRQLVARAKALGIDWHEFEPAPVAVLSDKATVSDAIASFTTTGKGGRIAAKGKAESGDDRAAPQAGELPPTDYQAGGESPQSLRAVFRALKSRAKQLGLQGADVIKEAE